MFFVADFTSNQTGPATSIETHYVTHGVFWDVLTLCRPTTPTKVGVTVLTANESSSIGYVVAVIY